MSRADAMRLICVMQRSITFRGGPFQVRVVCVCVRVCVCVCVRACSGEEGDLVECDKCGIAVHEGQ